VRLRDKYLGLIVIRKRGYSRHNASNPFYYMQSRL
jgi:hypothetical protein